jgi:hypothetical protein
VAAPAAAGQVHAAAVHGAGQVVVGRDVIQAIQHQYKSLTGRQLLLHF